MNYCVVHNAERKASKNLSYVNIPEHLKISILKIILNLESVFWLNVSGRWNISRGLLKECAMHRITLKTMMTMITLITMVTMLTMMTKETKMTRMTIITMITMIIDHHDHHNHHDEMIIK